VVEHQELPIARRFESQVLGPICGRPFKVLEKKLSDIYKLKLLENLRFHPTFHVSFFKSIACNASRPSREHNSRPPPDLVHNEPEFEVEAVLDAPQAPC
jgi:hypothetical protein